MKFTLFCFITLLMLASCENDQTQSFQVTQPVDHDLNLKTQTYISRLTQACPGLNRYSKDLTSATVGTSAMEGYEGGLELQFRVVQKPQELPAPLNIRSAQNSCYISINKEGSRAYIGKSACHSICEGTWQENSSGLMGREFALK